MIDDANLIQCMLVTLFLLSYAFSPLPARLCLLAFACSPLPSHRASHKTLSQYRIAINKTLTSFGVIMAQVSFQSGKEYQATWSLF
jgi:hypothetical protein